MIEEVSVHSIFSLKLGMFVLVMRKLLSWSIDDTIKWHLLHELESCRMDRRGVQKFTCEGRVEYCTRIVHNPLSADYAPSEILGFLPTAAKLNISPVPSYPTRAEQCPRAPTFIFAERVYTA